MSKIKGRIIRGVGGFYYVQTDEGDGYSRIIECKPKGAFRHTGLKPAVGDYVIIEEEREGLWFIIEILERRNLLTRPVVSNVDLGLICVSVQDPNPDLLLVDKLIVNCERRDIQPVILVTKTDLSPEAAKSLREVYRLVGFETVGISNTDGVDDELEKVTELMRGKIAFLAGQSGVGKSTLSNRICGKQMETGEISRKLGRGKHTTRHAELLETNDGGYLMDTPGFSLLELDDDLEPWDLQSYYPEFEGRECRFSDCSHIKEPNCGVKEAVRKGEIDRERYVRYRTLYRMLSERKKY